MKYTFIYALCDPDTEEVKYVGKSNNPKSRLSRHIADSKIKTSEKLIWVKSLLSINKLPLLKILEKVPVEVWEIKEKFWINQFKDLTNMIPGGNVSPMTDQNIINKMVSTKRNNPQKISQKTRDKLSIIRKEEWRLGLRKGKPKSDLEKELRKIQTKEIWAKRNKEQRKEVGKLISLGKTKKVIQKDLKGNIINIHPSRKEAAKFLGYKQRSIKLELAFKTGIPFKGFIWEYLPKIDELVVNNKMN